MRIVTIVLVGSALLTIVIGCDREAEETPSNETARTQPSEQSAKSGRRKIWLGRMLKAIDGIKDPDKRSFAASLAAMWLAENGNHKKAHQLVDKFVSADSRNSALNTIASTQSFNGDLEQAMLTVKRLPDQKTQDDALVYVVMAQLNRGKIDRAITLMRKIKTPDGLDSSRHYLAEAQAEAGDLEAAKATATKIIDEDTRGYAMQAIAKGKVDKKPAEKSTEGTYLRVLLDTLLKFRQGGQWTKHTAAALAAAKQKNNRELDIQIAKTLKSIENAEEPTPAMARLFLCAALMEAGRMAEAKTMAHAFQADADGEIVGISGLFGKPALAYLFTRLGMEDELDKIRVTKPGSMANNTSGIMRAVGAAEGDAKNWEGLEKRFKKLTPTERANLACGVLIALPKTPKPTDKAVNTKGQE